MRIEFLSLRFRENTLTAAVRVLKVSSIPMPTYIGGSLVH